MEKASWPHLSSGPVVELRIEGSSFYLTTQRLDALAKKMVDAGSKSLSVTDPMVQREGAELG